MLFFPKKNKRRHGSMSTQAAPWFESLEDRVLLSHVLWSPGPDLPAARTEAAVVVSVDRSILLLGGDSTAPRAVHKLAEAATSWTTAPDIDTVRHSPGAARWGSQIYLYGGTNGTEGINESLQYDYVFGDSQDLAKMLTPRYDFAFASDESGRVYAIGGISELIPGGVRAQAERYDPATGLWGAIAPLPQARHGMSAVYDGAGHIFVFGGSTTLDDSGVLAGSLRYDIATNSWSDIAPMPEATRDHAAVLTTDGSIYVLGGKSPTGAVATVQVYDPATDSWTTDADLPAAVYSHAAVYDSLGRIVVAGGFDASGTATTSVYRSQRLDVPETPPLITTAPVVTGALDKFYTYDVNASGNPNPTFTLVTAPTGMTIDPVTGLISWQPVDGQTGAQNVTVRALNRVGSVDQSFAIEVLSDTTPPSSPTALQILSVGTTAVELGWDPATDNVGVHHYNVYEVIRTGWRGSQTGYRLVKSDIPSTSTILTGLTPLTTHKYVVRAVDAQGNQSPNSNVVIVATQSAPTLNYTFNGSLLYNPPVTMSAGHPITIQLFSSANPVATFSLVSGPETMTVDTVTGLVQWTPTPADVGTTPVVFRASNSVGSTDLTVPIAVTPDVPTLSVVINPGSPTPAPFAVAGTPFTAQINDASVTPSTYELLSGPQGMTIDAATGLIAWLPTAADAGRQTVTVRGTNAAGVTDLGFGFDAYFTGPASNIQVTGLKLLSPMASWAPPTGEGSDLVAGYTLVAVARYRYGRAWRTEQITYNAPGAATSFEMTGLTAGRTYTLTIRAVDAAGNVGQVSSPSVQFVPRPAVPVISWTIQGPNGGPVIAGQPMVVQLTDSNPDPRTYSIVSAPAGFVLDPVTGRGQWTPDAEHVGTTDVILRATNSVGPRDVMFPIQVHFSGAVQNATAINNNAGFALVNWQHPLDNVLPIANYDVTLHWTWSGRNYSRTTRLAGTDTGTSLALVPTGAVWFRGVTIVAIDPLGRYGVSSGLIPIA